MSLTNSDGAKSERECVRERVCVCEREKEREIIFSYSKGFTALSTLKDHSSANGVLLVLVAILIESTRTSTTPSCSGPIPAQTSGGIQY